MADSILKKHQLDIAVGVELNDAQRKATSAQIKNMASQWQDMLDNAIKKGIEDGARSASLKDVLTQFNAQLKAFKLEPLTITVDELQIMDKPIEHAAKLVIQKLGDSFKGGGLGSIISEEITDSLNTLGGTVDKIYQKMEQGAKKSADNIEQYMLKVQKAASKISKDQMKSASSAIDRNILIPKEQPKAREKFQGIYTSSKSHTDKTSIDAQIADVNFVRSYEHLAKKNKLSEVFGDQLNDVTEYYTKLAKIHQTKMNYLNDILVQNEFVGGTPKKPIQYTQFKGGEPWAREKTLQEVKSILSGGLTVKGGSSGSGGENLNTSKLENDLNQTIQSRMDAEQRAKEAAEKIAAIQEKMQKQGFVVYRGINEEDATESRNDGQSEYGAEYWAKDKKTALSYAVGSEDDTHTQLLKSVASPKKPLVLDMETHEYGDIKDIPALIDTLKGLGLDIRSLFTETNDVSADEIQQTINKFAKDQDYDAVITNNVRDANIEGAPITSTIAVLDDSILSTIQAFDVIEGVLQETATKIAEWYHAPNSIMQEYEDSSDSTKSTVNKLVSLSDEWQSFAHREKGKPIFDNALSRYDATDDQKAMILETLHQYQDVMSQIKNMPTIETEDDIKKLSELQLKAMQLQDTLRSANLPDSNIDGYVRSYGLTVDQASELMNSIRADHRNFEKDNLDRIQSTMNPLYDQIKEDAPKLYDQILHGDFEQLKQHIKNKNNIPEQDLETELEQLRQEQEAASKEIEKYTKKEENQRKELEKIQSKLPAQTDEDSAPPSNTEEGQVGATGSLDSESIQVLANAIKEVLASQGDLGDNEQDKLARENTLSSIYELLQTKVNAVQDEAPAGSSTEDGDGTKGNVISSESIQQLANVISNTLTLQSDGDNKTQLATEATLQNVVRLLNGGLTLEESAAINDEIARLKSDLGLSRNQGLSAGAERDITDSAKEALLHAISAVENEVKKKDLNVKKKDEAGTNLNTRSGEFSNIRIGTEGSVKIGNAIVEGFSTFGKSKDFDASYHTHPSRVAAPSVVDVQGALDGLNTLKTHIIQAGKEVLQMDFNGIAPQELQEILNAYRDAANIIKTSFEEMSDDEVKSQYGTMAEKHEAMQVELRKAWIQATQKYPSINTYVDHDMPQYTIPERYVDASQEIKELVERLAAYKTDYLNDDISEEEWDILERLQELDKHMSDAINYNNYQDWYQARDIIDMPSVDARERTAFLASQRDTSVNLSKNADDSEIAQKIARLTQLESMTSGSSGIAQENTLQQILQAVNIISRGQVNTGANSPDSVYEAFRRMLESDRMEGAERAEFMDSKTGNVSNHITGTEGEVLADKLDVLFKNYTQRMNIDTQIHSHAGSNDPYFSNKDLDRFAYDRQSKGINQQVLVSDKNISKLDLSKVDDINIEPLLNELKNTEHDFAKLGEIAQKYGAQYQTMQFADFTKDVDPQQLMDFLGVKAGGTVDGSVDKESINNLVGAIKAAITPQSDGVNKDSAERYALESTLQSVKNILDQIQTNTSKPKSAEMVQTNTDVGNVLATENTLSAIKTAVEAINKKVVQGTKAKTSNSGNGKMVVGKKNSESYAGSQYFPEKIKTQTMYLAKFRAQLMTTGKLTDDIDVQIYELLDGLNKVQNGPDLSKWNQQFLQLKTSVGIEGIFDKAEDKISTASYEELIELQKTRNQLELKYEKAKDGSVLKQFYAEQLSQLDGVIVKQEEILKNEEYEAKLAKMRVNQERKLGEEKAKMSDKDATQALREEIKQLRKKNNIDIANNRYNAGRRAMDDLWKLDATIDPNTIPEVVELRAALNSLEDQYNAVNRAMQKGDAVSDEEIADLHASSGAVAEKTARLKELLKNYTDLQNGEEIGQYVNGIGTEQEQLQKAINDRFGGKAKIKEYRQNADGTVTAIAAVKTGTRAFTEYTVAVSQADDKIKMLTGTTKQVPGFLDSVKRKLGEISQYVSAMSVISRAGQELRKGIQYVRDIDLAMTELKKVTDETEETYDKFLDTASKTAAKVGSTIKDVVSSTADFARIGYTLKEAALMAESAQILMNVSEFTDVNTATDTLISAVKAFGYTAEETMNVVDTLNIIGNNYAISTADLATSLTKSSASLVAAGGDLAEAAALTATANAIVQDADSVGTALKTTSLRLRGTSVTELEEEGVDSEGAVTSKSKLQSKVKALSGVDILTESGDYKSTYQILSQIADVWEDINNMDQAKCCLYVQKCA